LAVSYFFGPTMYVRALAVSPYSWLMTHCGWLAG